MPQKEYLVKRAFTEQYTDHMPGDTVTMDEGRANQINRKHRIFLVPKKAMTKLANKLLGKKDPKEKQVKGPEHDKMQRGSGGTVLDKLLDKNKEGEDDLLDDDSSEETPTEEDK
jgi:hypothetical protein